MGTLWVVATPIGNLEDITARAQRILAEVSLIAAEDTRHTGRLLAHFGIATPQLSYHRFNARARQERLLAALAAGDVALVTDAGTPGISDPGMELVDAAHEAGIPVRSVPGPSALATAVSVSGVIDGPFAFLGFLPRSSAERTAALARLPIELGIVVFESPNRVAAMLRDAAAVRGGCRFAVVRELSKLHEEIVRGTLSVEADLSRFEQLRGEIVVVIAGGTAAAEAVDVEAELRKLLGAGVKPNAAAKAVAGMTGRPKSEVYALAVRLSSGRINDERANSGRGDVESSPAATNQHER